MLAVDDLSFDVHPGVVTGFLGPNGSGKSTTMRCMLGLDRHESGTATFDGRPFTDLRRPLFEVGALLDAGYVHPARSGRNHLRWLAATNGIPRRRVSTRCWSMVGLTDVADRKVRGYSLGHAPTARAGRRAARRPAHDRSSTSPANGLDPEGVRWIRDVLVHLARQGRTVLVSSHLLSEIALMADDLVVIGKGRLIEQGPVDDFVERHTSAGCASARRRCPPCARRSPPPAPHVREGDATTIDVFGVDAAAVGEVAHDTDVVLHELSSQTESLEERVPPGDRPESEQYRTQSPR